MNEGAWLGFGGKCLTGGPKCGLCLGLGRSCYRFVAPGGDFWVYVILPCGGCRHTEYKAERMLKKYPPLHFSERWVNVPVEQQLARLAQQAGEPTTNRTNERVEEEL